MRNWEGGGKLTNKDWVDVVAASDLSQCCQAGKRRHGACCPWAHFNRFIEGFSSSSHLQLNLLQTKHSKCRQDALLLMTRSASVPKFSARLAFPITGISLFTPASSAASYLETSLHQAHVKTLNP